MPSRSVGAAQIESVDNAQIKRIARLLDSARERRAAGRIVIEGPHLISAFARANTVFETIAVSAPGLDHAEVRALFEECPAGQRLVLSERVFAKLSDLANPVGILAVCARPGSSIPITAAGDLIVLDRIQDAGNVGTILRTAAAAGIHAAICVPGTADPWSPRVLRAAMGAHCALAIIEEAFAPIRRAHAAHQVLATAADSAVALYDTDLAGPTIWMFGNEGAGLDPGLRAQATQCVRIPIAGSTESLNVAAAVAVCLFEQRRQRAVGQSRTPGVTQ